MYNDEMTSIPKLASKILRVNLIKRVANPAAEKNKQDWEELLFYGVKS